MPTHETAAQRGARRARRLLIRTGEELRIARLDAGLSSRFLGSMVRISHTQVLRIERGAAPHVDISVLARMAAALGHDLALSLHPSGAPIRDVAHVRLLERLHARIHPSMQWRTEVAIPIAGDRRAADATLRNDRVDAMVEAETRLGDLQALERRTSSKARDLGVPRVVLLVLDSRHNRQVIRETPALHDRFPIDTRTALAALALGDDPAGDCLIVL